MVMRYGLYLADLCRQRTDSHGTINYALGLAAHLPAHLKSDEALVYFVNSAIRAELPEALDPRVEIVTCRTPTGQASRLLLDHVRSPLWARQSQLDVIHYPKGFLPLWWLGGRVRTVVTIADDIPHRYARGDYGRYAASLRMRYFSSIGRRSFRRADTVITVSHFSAKSLRETFSFDRPVVVIHEGSALPALPIKGLAEKAKQLLLLGSRLPHKRSAQAIGWVLKALDELPGYRLVVTGSLTDEAEAACGHPRVDRYPRTLSNIEVADLIRSSRVLLFPSVLEGFGLPPIEACLLGTPAVWSRCTAISEVMRDLPGGFAPDDPDSFVKALHQTLTLGDETLQRLRAEAKRRLDWHTAAEQTLSTYRATASRTQVTA